MALNQYGIGVSSETAVKQDNLRGLLNIIMPTAKKNMLNRRWNIHDEFCIFDLNAARSNYPGEDGETITGSAAIGIETARQYGINYTAMLCELQADNALDLSIHFAEDDRVSVLCGDCCQTLPSYLAKDDAERFGYVYADPNDGELPIELLIDIFNRRAYRRTDLIVNIAAASLKRTVNLPGYNDRNLDKLYGSIDKRNWLVRQEHGKHQWTLIVATNWVNMPEWTKAGFYRKDSEEGKAIWRTVAMTKKQRTAEVQPSFFS